MNYSKWLLGRTWDERRGCREKSFLLAFGGMQGCLIVTVDFLLLKTRIYSNPCGNWNQNRFPLNLDNVQLYLSGILVEISAGVWTSRKLETFSVLLQDTFKMILPPSIIGTILVNARPIDTNFLFKSTLNGSQEFLQVPFSFVFIV